VRAELSQSGFELVERDFFKDTFSRDELIEIIGSRNPEEFFSFRSPSFKKLGVEREDLKDDELIDLMLQEPRLIRRPLISGRGMLFVGTDKKMLREFLN
tara:strand:- start:351 stop:647 length:297 start_codon:yes stop_codon:yes gene_type:complete